MDADHAAREESVLARTSTSEETMSFDRKYIEGLDLDQLRGREFIECIAGRIVDDAECDDYLLVEVADRLLRIGELETAKRVAKMLDETWATEAIPLLCRIAESLAVRGEVRQARRLLSRALIASEDCDVGRERAQAFISVARWREITRQIDKADQIVFYRPEITNTHPGWRFDTGLPGSSVPCGMMCDGGITRSFFERCSHCRTLNHWICGG